GTSSGIPVTFTSLTPSVCTLTGSTVTLIDSGTCTVAADQAAAGDYTAAPQVTQSFTVAPLLPLPTTTPQITGADGLGCALRSNGTVSCWGYNGINPVGLTNAAQISS